MAKPEQIDEELLLTSKEIAGAIREEDCRLHGITSEQATKDPELLLPDGVVTDMIVPPEVELRAFNKAICKAQFAKAKPIIERQAMERVFEEIREHGQKVVSHNIYPPRYAFVITASELKDIESKLLKGESDAEQ